MELEKIASIDEPSPAYFTAAAVQLSGLVLALLSHLTLRLVLHRKVSVLTRPCQRGKAVFYVPV